MDKQAIISEIDFQIRIQNEYIKGYKKLDFYTETIEQIALDTIKMLENLKLKAEQL